jgi:hypothetical protein
VTKEPENLVGQVSEGMVDGELNAGSQGN